jgi:hypothetical protein
MVVSTCRINVKVQRCRSLRAAPGSIRAAVLGAPCAGEVGTVARGKGGSSVTYSSSRMGGSQRR